MNGLAGGARADDDAAGLGGKADVNGAGRGRAQGDRRTVAALEGESARHIRGRTDGDEVGAGRRAVADVDRFSARDRGVARANVDKVDKAAGAAVDGGRSGGIRRDVAEVDRRGARVIGQLQRVRAGRAHAGEDVDLRGGAGGTVLNLNGLAGGARADDDAAGLIGGTDRDRLGGRGRGRGADRDGRSAG